MNENTLSSFERWHEKWKTGEAEFIINDIRYTINDEMPPEHKVIFERHIKNSTERCKYRIEVNHPITLSGKKYASLADVPDELKSLATEYLRTLTEYDLEHQEYKRHRKEVLLSFWGGILLGVIITIGAKQLYHEYYGLLSPYL